MAEILLVFNESEGLTVPNLGSGSDCVLDAPGGGTETFVWHPDEGPWDGYLDINTSATNGGGNNDMTVVAMNAATVAQTGDANVAIGFNLQSFDTTTGKALLKSTAGANGQYGGIAFTITPASTGDFDVDVTAQDSDGTPFFSINLPDLSFGVDYQIAASFDVTGGPLRALLDDGTVQTDATGGGNMSPPDYWLGDPGDIGRQSNGFADYQGIEALLHYYYEDHTSAVWDDTALAAVNADPTTTLDGWPAGGASVEQFTREQANPLQRPADQQQEVLVSRHALDETIEILMPQSIM